MAREKWYESDSPNRHAWGIGRIMVVAALVTLLFGALLWAFHVVTSDIKGQGDATRQNNSAANRLQAQAKYSSLYEGILAADRNLDTLAAAVADDPSQFNKTNLLGAQNVCQSNVGSYNAMATNALTRDWIPAGLPTQVGYDPATDCAPTAATPTPEVSPASDND